VTRRPAAPSSRDKGIQAETPTPSSFLTSSA
jgi:hypothetical protein